MKAVAIQLNTIDNQSQNLLQVEKYLKAAVQETHPDLIALPEMFAFMGGTLEQKKAAAETFNSGKFLELLKTFALEHKVMIHAGSICEFDSGRYFNTSFIIDSNAALVAKYRKMHLFNFTGESVSYSESQFLSAGNNVVTYKYKNFIIGCAICFDLRFGNLFQQLIAKKVDIIILPSAFTDETGRAHWEILCRARAIETQSYLIAPAQTGFYLDNNQERKNYGHSMIVDPWGNILAQCEKDIGFISAEIDHDFIEKVRQKLPIRTTESFL